MTDELDRLEEPAPAVIASVRLRDIHFWDAEGNLYMQVPDWEPVPWLADGCEHLDTMCERCVDSWISDHEVKGAPVERGLDRVGPQLIAEVIELGPDDDPMSPAALLASAHAEDELMPAELRIAARRRLAGELRSDANQRRAIGNTTMADGMQAFASDLDAAADILDEEVHR